MVTEIAPFSSENSNTDIFSEKKLSDLGYADNTTLLNEDGSKLQVFFDCLNGSVGTFSMRFRPSRCKVLGQKWSGSKPKLVHAKQQLDDVDRCSYFGSSITTWWS